jgi:hypothetical protein
MEWVKSPRGDPPPDGALVKSRSAKLPPCHHTVLAIRDPQDQPLAWPTSGPHIGLNVDHVGHGDIVASKHARVAPGLCGNALDRWEKWSAEISDRCPKTGRPREPRLTSVP